MSPTDAPGAHWEEFWRAGHGESGIMGADAPRAALDAFWRRHLAQARFTRASLALDIASGAGPIARLAERELDAAARPLFVCADYAPAALAAARASLKRAVLPVACDALALPFRPRSFAAVFSQFGLEYAGAKAFGEAALMAAPGAPFAAVIHYRGGVIEAECRDNSAAAAVLIAGGAIARARVALGESYAVGRADETRAEAAFAETLTKATRRLNQLKGSPGRDMSLRYAGDLAQLSARRFAYAPGEAMSWLDAAALRLRAYRARMDSMIAAARSEGHMKDIARRVEAAGLVDVAFGALSFRPGDAPGAWTLTARRPS